MDHSEHVPAWSGQATRRRNPAAAARSLWLEAKAFPWPAFTWPEAPPRCPQPGCRCEIPLLRSSSSPTAGPRLTPSIVSPCSPLPQASRKSKRLSQGRSPSCAVAAPAPLPPRRAPLTALPSKPSGFYNPPRPARPAGVLRGPAGPCPAATAGAPRGAPRPAAEARRRRYGGEAAAARAGRARRARPRASSGARP